MFATIPPDLRTDGSSLGNLMRNMGSSTGIAIATVLLSRNIQINHAELGANITRFGLPVDLDRIGAYGEYGEAALRVVDAMVNKQAAMIAYLDDYWLMSIACVVAIPLLLILKVSKGPPPSAEEMQPSH
jgi:DHA2 family multidrug resistance protein